MVQLPEQAARKTYILTLVEFQQTMNNVISNQIHDLLTTSSCGIASAVGIAPYEFFSSVFSPVFTIFFCLDSIRQKFVFIFREENLFDRKDELYVQYEVNRFDREKRGKNKKCSHFHSLCSTPTRQEQIQKLTDVNVSIHLFPKDTFSKKMQILSHQIKISSLPYLIKEIYWIREHTRTQNGSCQGGKRVRNTCQGKESFAH